MKIAVIRVSISDTGRWEDDKRAVRKRFRQRSRTKII